MKVKKRNKSKGSINSGKRLALSILGNHVKKRLRDKEEEMAVEIRDCDESQYLTGEDEDAESMFCAGLFSEDSDSQSLICCSTCLKWSRALFANMEGEVSVCDMC
jgi:hypothetical protein